MSEDSNHEILVELRKLKRIFYAILVFIILGSIPAFYAGFTRGYSQADSWERVTTAMRRQDFAAALSLAQSLVRQQPDYSYGHAWLGAIYLAMDDVTNSEAQYSRACQLFPSEEYEKDLAAVRKRMTNRGGDFKLMSK
jgi:cytochrome c-type biogenesis protein CcmH/NrfG